MKSIKIVVAYNERVISIPFKNIALIDEFTTFYDNNQDIGIALNEILDLQLKDTSINKIYISKTTQKDELSPEYTEYLPIKYSFDNYDIQSVIESYIDYIIKNQRLLQKKDSALNKVMINYMRKYDKINLSNYDIERIILSYLSNGSGNYSYDRIRAAYFTLIKNGYKIKKEDNKETNNIINRTDLTKYNSQDEFFEYLIYYSTISEEAKSKAIDMMASESIEDIDRKMYNSNHSLFDTKEIKTKRNYYDDALLLQALTNMTIQDLVNLINNYQMKTKEKTKGKAK